MACIAIKIVLLNRRFPDSFKTLVHVAHARIEQKRSLDFLAKFPRSNKAINGISPRTTHASFFFFFLSQRPDTDWPFRRAVVAALIAFRISLNQTSLRKMEEEEPERSGPFDPLLSKTSFDSFFFASILKSLVTS